MIEKDTKTMQHNQTKAYWVFLILVVIGVATFVFGLTSALVLPIAHGARVVGLVAQPQLDITAPQIHHQPQPGALLGGRGSHRQPPSARPGRRVQRAAPARLRAGWDALQELYGLYEADDRPGALKALAERKLVNYAPYEVVTLTTTGEEAARDVVRLVVADLEQDAAREIDAEFKAACR